MTNFDKWKQGLTIEDLIERSFFNCTCCPAKGEQCRVNFIDRLCKDALTEWANKECEEMSE